ncbi:MAG: response regulator [Acidobacteriota bacterium]
MTEEKLHRSIEILLVEDSPTDALLTREAFDHCPLNHHLHHVENGADALAYLRRENGYASRSRPDLILLDLNLPRKNGIEVLREIKNEAQLASIPVVVLTTSQDEADIVTAYDLHANCYITKPVEFDELVAVARAIGEFWFGVVTLPRNKKIVGSSNV